MLRFTLSRKPSSPPQPQHRDFNFFDAKSAAQQTPQRRSFIHGAQLRGRVQVGVVTREGKGVN